jgi:hypothetical protein
MAVHFRLAPWALPQMLLDQEGLFGLDGIQGIDAEQAFDFVVQRVVAHDSTSLIASSPSERFILARPLRIRLLIVPSG